jgi:mono/diheme cytochrome c family protein
MFCRVTRKEAAAIALALGAALAVAAVTARGADVETVTTVNEDGYSFKDGSWWKDGLPYGRTQEGGGGGYYRDHYGHVYYRAYPTYYRYYRLPLVVKTVAPKPPPYGPDWQVKMLEYARSRDDYQAYLKSLEALGLRGQTYAFQGSVGSYASSYAAPAQGLSQYGYSYQQIQTAYGDLSLSALYQQQGRLVQGAQLLAEKGLRDHTDLVAQAGDNQARVAEILAKAQAARTVLEGVNPQPSIRTETTIKGLGQSTVPPGAGKGRGEPLPPPKPKPEDRDDDDAAVKNATRFLQEVGIPRCGACHGPQGAKGGFEILKYPQMTGESKAKVWARLLAADPEKRMPQKGTADDHKPGEPLPPNELKAFLTN